jgi:hypothetical protein
MRHMSGKACISLTVVGVGLLLVDASCYNATSKETCVTRAKITGLQQWQMPDPELVRGILIYNAYRDYLPTAYSHEFPVDTADVYLALGNCHELERLVGRRLVCLQLSADSDAVRTIATTYARAMDMRQNLLLGCPERIAFVTGDGAFIRGFNSKYGTVLDAYMVSGALWREFRKIGALEETEPDANAPSYVPPVLEAPSEASGSLSGRGVRIVALSPYEMPSEDVRGILIYGESNIDAERGLEDRNLCLAIGNPQELRELLRGAVAPRLMVTESDAIPRICRLYAEALKPFRDDAAKRNSAPHRSMYGTAWTIAFVTDRAVYIRGFGTRPHQRTVYDEWMESGPELYQEFVKIGYLKEAGQ